MKLIVIIFALLWSFNAQAETKKVCVDIKDKAGKIIKDSKGTPKQKCKEVKKHKKLKGTKVPAKK